MSKTLLFTTVCNCKVYKSRKYDTDIRLHTRVTSLSDISISVTIPAYTDYDVLLVPIRQSETFNDPFTTKKEDTPSFFSVYESQEDSYIQSSYISPNLQTVSALSKRLLRPLGNFSTVDAISSNDVQMSISNKFVVLNFMEASGFKNYELMRNGIGCIYFENKSVYAPTNNVTLNNCFNVSAVLFKGLLNGITLPLKTVTEGYCVLYYFVLYTPLAEDYYFQIQCTNGAQLEIDGIKVISVYSSDSYSTLHQGSISLEIGFHTVLIRQVEFPGTNTGISIKVSMDQGATWNPLTVTDCESVGMEIYALPYSYQDIDSEKTTIIASGPQTMMNMSLNSLYLKYYRPIIVLARIGGELLENEILNLRYYRAPTSVSSSTLLVGTIDLISNERCYTFPYSGTGVVFSTQVPIIYITYAYNPAIEMDWFELVESSQLEVTTYDTSQCAAFNLSLKDEFGEYYSAKDLVNTMLDIENSLNVSSYLVFDLTTVQVTKTQLIETTKVKLKKGIVISSLQIFSPSLTDSKWGYVTSLRVYNGALHQVELVDIRGVSTDITSASVSNELNPVKYTDIGCIPSMYNASQLPDDLQYGAEYIMFCLNVLGTIDEITVLGNVFPYTNPNTCNMTNVSSLFNIGQLSIVDQRISSLYLDKDKIHECTWAYFSLNKFTNNLVVSDYSTIHVQVINTSTSVMTNHLITVNVPNIAVGYTAINEASVSCNVAGKQIDGSLTSDPIAWNSTFVTILIPSLGVGESTTITLSTGSFSDISTVTGATNLTYTAHADLHPLEIAIVNIPQVNASATTHIYGMESSTRTVNTTYPYVFEDTLTVCLIYLTELLGKLLTGIEYTIEVKELVTLYNRAPFVVVNSVTKVVLPTVGVNSDGSLTNDIDVWDGDKIRVKIDRLPEGQTTLFFLRIGNFSGDPSTFSTTLTTGLLLYFQFSANTTSTVDNVFVTASPTNLTLTTNKYNENFRAYYFGGVSSWMQIVYSPLPGSGYTLSLWIQTSVSDNAILDYSDNSGTTSTGGHDRELWIDADGHLNFRIVDSVETICTVETINSLADNNWHHIVVTVDLLSGVKIYIDGDFQYSNTLPRKSVNIAFTYIRVGLHGSNTYASNRWYTGKIDEFRLYTRVLSQSDITLLFEIYDGMQRGVSIATKKTQQIISPSEELISLVDMASVPGTPLIIYKYFGINESVVEWIT